MHAFHNSAIEIIEYSFTTTTTAYNNHTKTTETQKLSSPQPDNHYE